MRSSEKSKLTEQGKQAATDAGQQPRGPERDHDAAEPATEREDEALRQELTHDARPARANRGADRELAAPRRAAREQHVGDVGAGDEQHETDGCEQRRARGAHVAVEHRMEANACRGDYARRHPLVGLWIGRRAAA